MKAKSLEQAARDAIGCEKSVKDGRGVVTRGVIVECYFVGWRERTCSKVARFRVVMECGTAKARREFTVERLPRRARQERAPRPTRHLGRPATPFELAYWNRMVAHYQAAGFSKDVAEFEAWALVDEMQANR